MAQASVAREPSMEEILASIRKIIESNDSAEEQSGAAGETESLAQTAPLPEGPDRPLSLLNKMSQPVTERTEETAEAEAGEASTGEPDMAAFHAMELRTASRDDEGGGESEDGEMMGITRSDEGVSSAAPTAALGEMTDIGNGAQPDEPKADNPGVVMLAAAGDEAEPARLDADMPEPAAATGGDEGEDGAQALLSPVVGARVAASFGNLNHAVTHGPTRSFDEIAEEMLRPMLQEWLDDNLPTLVERLVREEIERIARGQ